MIIIYPAEDFKEYIELGNFPRLPIPEKCPDCNGVGTLVRNGYYERWCNTETEECRLRIGRVRCTNKSCRVSHALLPGFLLPYRQSTAKVVEIFVRVYLFAGKTLDEAMQAATKSNPARQKGASWIKSLAGKFREIRDYASRLIPRFWCREDPPGNRMHLRKLYRLLKMLFARFDQVGSALARISFQFYKQMGKRLV